VRGGLAGAALALALTAGAAQADFRGGGMLLAFTDTCRQQGWPATGGLPVRVRYAPSELYGMPSQVTIALGSGVQHYAIWAPLEATTQVFQGQGRQIRTNFLLHPNRPRVRPVQRRITERVNPALPDSVGNARAMFLRLRIENFDNLPGCSVTLAANLRRF
jgi:hypothetical protein